MSWILYVFFFLFKSNFPSLLYFKIKKCVKKTYFKKILYFRKKCILYQFFLMFQTHICEYKITSEMMPSGRPAISWANPWSIRTGAATSRTGFRVATVLGFCHKNKYNFIQHCSWLYIHLITCNPSVSTVALSFSCPYGLCSMADGRWPIGCRFPLGRHRCCRCRISIGRYCWCRCSCDDCSSWGRPRSPRRCRRAVVHFPI